MSNIVGRLILPDFKTDYKAMQSRPCGIPTKLESPEIEPYLYQQLIFDKSRKINNMLSTYGAGTSGFYVDMKGELGKLDFIEIENYALQKILLKE